MKFRILRGNSFDSMVAGTARYSHTQALAIVTDAIRSGKAGNAIYILEAVESRLTDADRARLASLKRRKRDEETDTDLTEASNTVSPEDHT